MHGIRNISEQSSRLLTRSQKTRNVSTQTSVDITKFDSTNRAWSARITVSSKSVNPGRANAETPEPLITDAETISSESQTQGVSMKLRFFTCRICGHKFGVRGAEAALNIAFTQGTIHHGLIGKPCNF